MSIPQPEDHLRNIGQQKCCCCQGCCQIHFGVTLAAGLSAVISTCLLIFFPFIAYNCPCNFTTKIGIWFCANWLQHPYINFITSKIVLSRDLEGGSNSKNDLGADSGYTEVGENVKSGGDMRTGEKCQVEVSQLSGVIYTAYHLIAWCDIHILLVNHFLQRNLHQLSYIDSCLSIQVWAVLVVSASLAGVGEL